MEVTIKPVGYKTDLKAAGTFDDRVVLRQNADSLVSVHTKEYARIHRADKKKV